MKFFTDGKILIVKTSTKAEKTPIMNVIQLTGWINQDSTIIMKANRMLSQCRRRTSLLDKVTAHIESNKDIPEIIQ